MPPLHRLSLCVTFEELQLAEELFQFWDGGEGRRCSSPQQWRDTVDAYVKRVLLPLHGAAAARSFAGAIEDSSLRESLLEEMSCGDRPRVDEETREAGAGVTERSSGRAQRTASTSVLDIVLSKVGIQRTHLPNLVLFAAVFVVLSLSRSARVRRAVRAVLSSAVQTLSMSIGIGPGRLN